MLEKESDGLPKAAVSWSSGKDSAYALLSAIRSREYELVALLTTVTSTYDRVSMHGVREELLARQSENIGLPVIKAVIPPNSSNEVYESVMQEATEKLKKSGVEYLIFGDIFLKDVREYREARMKGTGIKPVFPLWGMDTKELSKKIIESGIVASIVCLDPKKLDKKFGGAIYDHDFLESLPEDVDRCGENGEFHTLVHKTPFFKKDIPVAIGVSVERDGFLFTDLYPATRP